MIPKTMRAAVMLDIHKMGFETRPTPSPEANEVLVQVEYVGICGSDLHYYHQGRIGHYIVEPPYVLGHESAGTVVALGEEVDHLSIGDRVALEPGKTCGVCEFCRDGEYNLCPDVIFFATPPVEGVFQEYIAHPANLCFKLPESVSTMEGALIEPLAVGFHAARLGGAHVGQTAVVFGTGCIGLTSVLALKAHGVNTIYVVDILENRLEKAREIGATATIDASKEDPVARLLQLTEGRGCDIAIETAGVDTTAVQAIEALRKGSTCVLVGYTESGMMTLPMGLAMDKELTFKTVFRYRHIYPAAIDAVASGAIKLKEIVTDVFAFDDIQEAMDRSISDKDTIVKAVIQLTDT